MINLFKVCITTLLISSCSISNIKLDAIKPAEINIPTHIESVVIANRTAPKKNNKIENILDGIISGEMIGVDKKSSQECLNSLKLELSNSPRFKLISTESIEFKGSGTAEISKPLKWKKIEKSLKNYEADGLIVLESFDSSSQVRELGTRERKKKINGEWKKRIEHIASLDVEVQAGWRIYDLKNKKIIDEKIFFDRKVFENADKTMVLAKTNLPALDYAVSQAGIFSGQQFYYRISPHYITINRDFFKNLRQIKGFKIKSDNSNNLFIRASKHVFNKNWQEAVEIWKPLTGHKNRFIASRACFNMALASEANGNIDISLSWVKNSIKQGNKQAKKYLKRLEKRKIDLAILEKQIIN